MSHRWLQGLETNFFCYIPYSCYYKKKLYFFLSLFCCNFNWKGTSIQVVLYLKWISLLLSVLAKSELNLISMIQFATVWTLINSKELLWALRNSDELNGTSIRSRKNRLLASVWCKMSTFQMVVVSRKGLPLPWDLRASIPLLRAFEWGTVC